MAIRGRKPKPVGIKILEGNPGKRPLPTEPFPTDKNAPQCPDWLLPEAKTEWARVAPLLAVNNILGETDITALANYCQTFARWKEAEEMIDKKGATYMSDSGQWKKSPWVEIAQAEARQLLKLCAEFGLTPSSRCRLAAGLAVGEPAEPDEMESLLSSL